MTISLFDFLMTGSIDGVGIGTSMSKLPDWVHTKDAGKYDLTPKAGPVCLPTEFDNLTLWAHREIITGISLGILEDSWHEPHVNILKISGLPNRPMTGEEALELLDALHVPYRLPTSDEAIIFNIIAVTDAGVGVSARPMIIGFTEPEECTGARFSDADYFYVLLAEESIGSNRDR